MKILISQMKPYLANTEKNLKEMENIINEGISSKCKAVIFPELSLTGTLLQDSIFNVYIQKVPELLLELSKEITIIFGGVEEEKNRLYNSGYILEDGKVIGKHRKICLSNMNGICEAKYFSKGKDIRCFKSKLGNIAITLGEESINPLIKKILAHDGADIIFNLTNLNNSEDIEIYEGAILGESYYSNNFNIFVNRVGVEDGVIFSGGSFAVSPYGKIIEKLEKFTKKSSIIDIDLKDVKRSNFQSSFSKEDDLFIIKKELERVINK